jgi:hypothetical protein
MNKIVGLVILLILTACAPTDPQVPITDFAATSTILDFGLLLPTDSQKLMTANLYNDTGVALSGPATISTNDFTLVSGFNCPLGAKNKTSCSAIKVSFTPQGKSPGTYQANLTLGSITIPLQAIINEPAPVDLASGIIFSWGDNLDWGPMLSSGNTITKTVIITNQNSSSLNLPVEVSNLSPFTLSYDTCSNKILNKNGSCQLKISLTPTALSGDLSATLSYAGHQLNLTAQVVTPQNIAQGETPTVINGVTYAPQVQFLINNNVATEYQVGEGYSVVNLTLKNSGNVATVTSSAQAEGSGIYVVSNGCLNRSLGPNTSCLVKLGIDSEQLTSESGLSFNGHFLPIRIIPPIPDSLLTIDSWVCPNHQGLAPGLNFTCNSSDFTAEIFIDHNFVMTHPTAAVNVSVGVTCDYLQSVGDNYFFPTPSTWNDFYLSPLVDHPLTFYGSGHTIRFHYEDWGYNNGYNQAPVTYVLYQPDPNNRYKSIQVYECLTLGTMALHP